MKWRRVLAAKMMKFQNNRVWERWVMIMACCNMCVMLLSIKREFVREMKKDMEIFRDMAAK